MKSIRSLFSREGADSRDRQQIAEMEQYTQDRTARQEMDSEGYEDAETAVIAANPAVAESLQARLQRGEGLLQGTIFYNERNYMYGVLKATIEQTIAEIAQGTATRSDVLDTIATIDGFREMLIQRSIELQYQDSEHNAPKILEARERLRMRKGLLEEISSELRSTL